MKLQSTLNTGRVPKLGKDAVYQLPIPPDPADTGFAIWQAFTTIMWGWLGVAIGEYYPLSRYVALPASIAAALGLVLVLLFAVCFFIHYLHVCTAELLPDARKNARRKLWRKCVMWALTFPLTWPWLLAGALLEYDELCQAWTSWFTYNRQGIVAPGILKSPCGPQPLRVWHYRLTIWVVAVATVETVGATAFFFLAVAILIGPWLKTLREYRHGERL